MLKWIEKTREKPKHIRNQYAFFIAFSVTSVIALAWIVSIPARFGEVFVEGEDTTETRGAFSRFFDDTRKQAASVFNSQENSSEVEPPTLRNASSSIEIPTLEDRTLDELREREAEARTPQPRTVLIATSSSESEIDTNLAP